MVWYFKIVFQQAWVPVPKLSFRSLCDSETYANYCIISLWHFDQGYMFTLICM